MFGESEPDPAPEPEPEPAPAPDPDPEPDAEPEPAADPGPNPDPQSEPGPELGPDPGPEPEPEPEPGQYVGVTPTYHQQKRHSMSGQPVHENQGWEKPCRDHRLYLRTLHIGICGIDGGCNSLIELLVGSLTWPEKPLL